MRRLLTGLVVLVAAAAGLSVAGTGTQAADDYRVDVIFDTAKGIIPGQQAKIAGARVGTVKDVVLTPDNEARIQLSIEARFRPFKVDAECDIQPEGLISERFVQCEPGTADAEELKGKGGEAPTVPKERTRVPVSITDLFQVFNTPVRERFTLVVASLGLAFAGRGEEVNNILRRSNPVLADVRDVVGILNRHKRELAQTVVSTDRAIAELARRKERVKQFIDSTAELTAHTANRRNELAQTVERLPGLLDAARPALERLDELTRDGTPVLRDLHAGADGLNRLTTGLIPFSREALPTLRDVGRIAKQLRSSFKTATPVVRLLRRFARAAGPSGRELNALLVSLRARGGVENLMSFFYRGAIATARYDTTSHILPAHFSSSACSVYESVEVPECSAKFVKGAGTAASNSATRDSSVAPADSTPAPGSQAPTGGTAPQQRTPLPQPVREVLAPLVDKLIALAKPQRQSSPNAIKNLLDYLLKP